MRAHYRMEPPAAGVVIQQHAPGAPLTRELFEQLTQVAP